MSIYFLVLSITSWEAFPDSSEYLVHTLILTLITPFSIFLPPCKTPGSLGTMRKCRDTQNMLLWHPHSTDRLALSSSVRSNHCTDAVCSGSMIRVMRWRARLQHRSERIGFRLYGIALEPAHVQGQEAKRERLQRSESLSMLVGEPLTHARKPAAPLRCASLHTHSPICCFSKGSSISLRFARSRMSVQIWGKAGVEASPHTLEYRNAGTRLLKGTAL